MDTFGNLAPPDTSKPYFCDVCGDNFKRHEHLIRHSRRHTQEKPFKCDVCQKEFARRDILSRHAIVHIPAAERATLPQKTQKRGTKRVQQACNNCAKGKCRCDGDTPCSTCQSKGMENCEYTLTSTPSKRKRADSSASTAAANVLLQVASSAHASPKGDWAMDYNPSQHDSGMQPPQPIVFGYQPTMNGPVPIEPFVFQYGLSRSESRYTSRAPSPSHDYDGQLQFHSGTAAISTFLFKDLGRDLPGVNSLLPRTIAITNSAGDFAPPAYVLPLGAGEQPGTYSNYRNDNATAPNGNFAPRPSSPTLTFPVLEVPAEFREIEQFPPVKPFTEFDWSRLQSFTQSHLPSVRVINVLIQLYFAKFQPFLPIIHPPTFSFEYSQVLVLAIMVVAAHYFDQERAPGLYQPLARLATRFIMLESETALASLQAQLLVAVADLYSVHSQNAIEGADHRRMLMLRNARANKLFEENYNETPPDDASTELRWQELLRAEERRRLSWAIWLHDNLFSNLFGARRLMQVEEVRTSLPCHERLWDPVSASEWAAQFAPDLIPLRTRALWSIGKLEDRSAAEFAEYGVFCRSILAFVEAGRMIGRAKVGHTWHVASETEDQQLQRLLTQSTADEKIVEWKAFDELESSISVSHGGLTVRDEHTLMNLYFARLTACIDLSYIRRHMLGDDHGLRGWVGDTPASARCAALVAANILRLSHSSRASPFSGMMTFYATLTLLCFAKYYPSDGSFPPLQLDEYRMGTPEARRWLERGMSMPVTKLVGSLDSTNLSRILQSSDLLQPSQRYWGSEILKLRMESLAHLVTA